MKKITSLVSIIIVAKLEEEEEDGDEPLYTEKDDEQPLDL